MTVKGFKGYGKAAVALDQINSISESLLTPELQTFIETNLPAVCPDTSLRGGCCFLVPCEQVQLAPVKVDRCACSFCMEGFSNPPAQRL